MEAGGGGAPETCSDGIQNQDETGVDTGGVCGGNPCQRHLVQTESLNQDETEIDIGGVCTPASTPSDISVLTTAKNTAQGLIDDQMLQNQKILEIIS